MTKAPKKTAKPEAEGTAPASAPPTEDQGADSGGGAAEHIAAAIGGALAAAATPILGEGDGSSAGVGIEPKALAASPEPKPEALQVVTKPPKEPTAVEVVGPEAGRWRAGRHFTKQPVIIPLEDLTDEQIDLLDADPSLTIRLID